MSQLVSLTNLLATAPVASKSSEDGAYPAVNAREPERPLMPWKTTALGEQWIVFDLGAATPLGLIDLIHPNAGTIRYEGNATDSGWATPAYTSGALTVARNLWNERYARHFIPTGFNSRYLRLVLQTPVDDGASVYRVGGVWAGASEALPSPLESSDSMDPFFPRTSEGPAHEGWEQDLVWGPVVTVLEAGVIAEMNVLTPGLGDELATWLDLERRIRAAGPFAFAMNLGDASACWIMKWRGAPWKPEYARARTRWILKESIGP